ncbi:uncharacterized protein LACBIDRAFT_305164 [Laccaria bicolor S238N-H82]|uniref:Predicted protein n=1 Tax=Laccaria bicolor (strain S238N-H82 / ATCC MYA-4686) TaxID=486041 RepID=B0CTK5_LACBS|nr:uncharacterized protein LACBIDRAFT_305164 [Laccaria bicolor S238N-H82]EDR13938.1 predicted protein [Laccaria bicolor S238N-H82]|eukprot:XP_001874497.1 predicted protein [Laccaria bicolor S238N-H82]
MCKQTLTRHTNAINTLQISQDGSRLLSGGDDCLVIVWDLVQGIEFQVISILFNGSISSSAWTPTSLDPISSFAFGCADGTLSVYCQVPTKNHYDLAASVAAHVGPVEDINFSLGSKQIATVGNGCLKLWTIDSNRQLSNIIATSPREAIARSVSFFDQGSSVLVTYLESHEV